MTLIRMENVEVTRPASAGEVSFRLSIEALTIRPGDRIGLSGASGSGKSTILELIALLIWPTRAGLFEFYGVDAAALLCRRDLEAVTRLRTGRLAYAPQNGGLLPYLSVLENAKLAGRLAGRASEILDKEIPLISQRLGIEHLLSKLPARLSGGERHRAALLRMATAGARLIVADEPTAALDRKTADSVITSLVETASATNAALVCASHDVDLLQKLDFVIAEVRDASESIRGDRHSSLFAT